MQPIIISGPCSAESRQQVLDTAAKIKECDKVSIFRSGIWKPRTRPNSFEGVGAIGLNWLKEVKQTYNLKTAVEVAIPEHVELALKADIDYLWIGARTSSNPFSIQELANVLKDCSKTILIKNPINPDLELWIGAIERMLNANVKDVIAIHRGFYPFEQTQYRNIPKWEIPIELKTRLPKTKIICDPSHIAGDKNLVQEVAQYALNLNFDGLMIESHINPNKALSDKQQQLTPIELKQMLNNLKVRKTSFDSKNSTQILEKYRNQIDSIDNQIIELLSQRMSVIKNIGQLKKQKNISAFQINRWRKMIRSRIEFGNKIGLNKSFLKKMLQIVHKESIRIQNQIMNK